MTDGFRTLFPFGSIVATPGAIQALEESGEAASTFLERHGRGDWGELSREDRELNDRAVVDGSRIFSCFVTQLGVRLWVITEAADEHGRRAATTLLLPEEY